MLELQPTACAEGPLFEQHGLSEDEEVDLWAEGGGDIDSAF